MLQGLTGPVKAASKTPTELSGVEEYRQPSLQQRSTICADSEDQAIPYQSSQGQGPAALLLHITVAFEQYVL